MRELKVQRYNEVKNDYVRVLIAGESKSGKTYTAGTFPSPFFIDTDGSGRSLKDKDIPFISYSLGDLQNKEVKVYKEIFYILTQLRNTGCMLGIDKDGNVNFENCENGYKVETLVFDSVTILADLACYEAMLDPNIGKLKGGGSGKRDPFENKATYDEYGVLGARLLSIFDVVKELPCNVVATAGIKFDKDEITGAISSFPDVLGGFRAKIGHRFDVVGYMEKTKDGNHVFYTTPVKKFAAGSRDKLPEKIINPTYEKMFG